jgi:hypothetical protein
MDIAAAYGVYSWEIKFSNGILIKQESKPLGFDLEFPGDSYGPVDSVRLIPNRPGLPEYSLAVGEGFSVLFRRRNSIPLDGSPNSTMYHLGFRFKNLDIYLVIDPETRQSTKTWDLR